MEVGVVLSLTQSGKLIYLHLSPTTQENILCQHNSILFHSTSSKGKKKKKWFPNSRAGGKRGEISKEGGDSAFYGPLLSGVSFSEGKTPLLLPQLD